MSKYGEKIIDHTFQLQRNKSYHVDDQKNLRASIQEFNQSEDDLKQPLITQDASDIDPIPEKYVRPAPPKIEPEKPVEVEMKEPEMIDCDCFNAEQMYEGNSREYRCSTCGTLVCRVCRSRLMDYNDHDKPWNIWGCHFTISKANSLKGWIEYLFMSLFMPLIAFWWVLNVMT